MSHLFVLVGPPGVGKTTWRARQELICDYKRKSDPDFPDLVVISQDDLVEDYAEEHGLTYSEAFKQADLKAFEREVKARFRAAVTEGKAIVLDRTNMSRRSRRFFLQEAKGYTTHAVIFAFHPAVLDDRLDRRERRTGKSIPAHVVRGMLRSFEAPTLGEFDKIQVDQTAKMPSLRQRLKFLWRSLRRRALVPGLPEGQLGTGGR